MREKEYSGRFLKYNTFNGLGIGFSTREQLHNLPRQKFMEAPETVGIPCAGGYTLPNKMPYLKDAFQSKIFLCMILHQPLKKSMRKLK